MTASGIFITGTDTGVGKTYIGSALCSVLHDRGLPVQPRKPVESGCRPDNQGELVAEDATSYYTACRGSIPLETICPFRFEAAVAPDHAARLAEKKLHLKQLEQACLTNSDELIIVEGAGGFFSPIAENALNADLAQTLNLPVLLVANDRLGAINQVLLTAAAIEQYGLSLTAVILNSHTQATSDKPFNNRKSLEMRLNCLILEVSENEMLDEDVLTNMVMWTA